MLVDQAVATVRSMVLGSSVGAGISVLSAPYDPDTDETITLRWPKANVQRGSLISCGLNTFLVTDVDSSNTVLSVLPSIDGGPNVAAPERSFVHFSPAFTTWAIVRELISEIDAMSSPDTGLFWPWTFVTEAIDHMSGMYGIPTTEGEPLPFRLVRSEYRARGLDTVQRFTDAEYQPNTNVIRVFADPLDAITYEFTLARPFLSNITSLDDDLDDFGVIGGLSDVPILGAASTMALGFEGRRTQPVSQGDSRRAGEVSAQSNSAMSRQWKARQKEAINQELSRLLNLYGYRTPDTSGSTRMGARW